MNCEASHAPLHPAPLRFMIYSQPRLLPAGDSAILVEFADEIRDDINDRVHAFAQLVRDHFQPPTSNLQSPISDLIPAYSSLLVCYDPRSISFSQLRDALTHLITPSPPHPLIPSRTIAIPTRYGGGFGPDLEFVARHNGIDEAEVIRLHTSVAYRVYFLGFTPGFAYLGSVPEQIAAPRLPTPRARVPMGSVGIAGRQAGVYPLESPGGWRIIGRTELRMFDATREPPALLRAGDRVRFVEIH